MTSIGKSTNAGPERPETAADNASRTRPGITSVDGAVLVACLRFVGIPGAHIGYLAVLAALLSLYPLTIFPFAGIGVLTAWAVGALLIGGLVLRLRDA